MSDAYDAFAEDYEWLYSDPRRIGEEQAQALAPWTDVDPSPRILDCACGTGRLALALARRGLEVVGADASPGMAARAQENEPEKILFPSSIYSTPTIANGVMYVSDRSTLYAIKITE